MGICELACEGTGCIWGVVVGLLVTVVAVTTPRKALLADAAHGRKKCNIYLKVTYFHSFVHFAGINVC